MRTRLLLVAGVALAALLPASALHAQTRPGAASAPRAGSAAPINAAQPGAPPAQPRLATNSFAAAINAGRFDHASHLAAGVRELVAERLGDEFPLPRGFGSYHYERFQSDRPLGIAGAEYGAIGMTGPAPATTAAGSRAISGPESFIIGAVSNLHQRQQTNLAIAQGLQRAALLTGDQAMIDRANTLAQSARDDLAVTGAALNSAESYRDRAFASDDDAAKYLGQLSNALGTEHAYNATNIQHYRDDRGILREVPHGPAVYRDPFRDAASNLLTEITLQDGRGAERSNLDQLMSLNALVTGSDPTLESNVINEIASARDYMWNTWEGDTLRHYYNARWTGQPEGPLPVLSPGRSAIAGVGVGLPPVGPGTAASSGNGRSGQAGANIGATAGANPENRQGQTAAEEPLVMPRQPGGPDYPVAGSRASTGNAVEGALAGLEPQPATGATGDLPRQPGGPAYPTAAPRPAVGARAGAGANLRTEQQDDGEAFADAEAEAQLNGPPGTNLTQALARIAIGEANRVVAGQSLFGGENLSIARTAPIYEGYDIAAIRAGSRSGARDIDRVRTGPSLVGWGPSSAGNSLAAAGWSLDLHGYSPSRAGLAGFSSGGLMTRSSAGEEGRSLISMGPSNVWSSPSRAGYSPSLVGGPYITGSSPNEDARYSTLFGNGANNPWDWYPRGSDAQMAAAAMQTPFVLVRDPEGNLGRESGGPVVASLLTAEQLRELTANGLAGLDRLLAQPFNVLLTWGAGSYDLDLHMTGPTSDAGSDRFHIYFAARGSQVASPFAELIQDCICTSGSEVILTTQLQRGGVYRVSVFNFGDQAAASLNLANASGAQLQIVRGGVAQSQGNGTTIVGGRVLYTTSPPPQQPGNTWLAVELDAANGRISNPDVIIQSQGAENVQ